LRRYREFSQGEKRSEVSPAKRPLQLFGSNENRARRPRLRKLKAVGAGQPPASLNHGAGTMPFDGVGFSENLALQKLDAVVELLATEAKWCKGTFRTPDGRHCLMGAMRAVQAQHLLEPIVLRAIRPTTGRSFWRIESFNDHKTTTHASVLRVLARAREEILASHGVSTRPRSSTGARLLNMFRAPD
jgi:hypothetical protein